MRESMHHTGKPRDDENVAMQIKPVRYVEKLHVKDDSLPDYFPSSKFLLIFFRLLRFFFFC